MPRLLSVRLALGGAVLAGLVTVGQAAVDLAVGPAAIEQALKLARSSEPERGRFHASYVLPVTEPLIEKLEIITEYRRMVLIAEERLAAGDWIFASGVRAAEEALRPWKQKLTVRTRIRFSPLHAYPAVPVISIGIGQNPDLLVPARMTTAPQYGLRTHPTQAPPLVGVVLEAFFDATAVGQRTLPLAIHGPDTLWAQATVDFGRLR